ncbi:NO-inducible flavohemoprotein [Rheinheimera mesophila]|uniref:Flavohemoprotein n=1 Tax=Rheinheimera mesophila TaxID=1547515 RepID=A0A3P3QJG9_9GAMM|nr:NO-inducible flavohemoprotein [Rheinheimera mesophila]KKL01849.1 dihydropteridine reductase [Rheinheimera mesophila]RRJ21195.1 NO-inducible flavohemoprotein [Rheinheimera mesophila]
MLSAQTIAIVKSTIPLLESAGVAITNHFYQRMFRLNPELKDIFNMTNQHSGRQQFALFSAIAAYAKNIDNLAVLTETVERVAHKHTSFFIQPEHYGIVGHHLIETLRELAPDAFTPEVEQAWTEAYGALATIFTGRERQLYNQTEQKPGGWYGPRRFKVKEKLSESELVSSFVLVPTDGEAVVDYQPGQYLGVKVKPAYSDYYEIRQYSLSDKPNGQSYRISVKRELGEVAGLVSNYLHNHIQVGDELDILPPAGDFFLQSAHLPTVLISAGVGLTPMLSMLESIVALKQQTPVFFLHACENQQQHSFAQRISQLQQDYPLLHNFTWYNKAEQNTAATQFTGLMDLKAVAAQLPLQSANFYLCGPTGFMKFAKDQLLALGVASAQIHYEVFGPHSDL